MERHLELSIGTSPTLSLLQYNHVILLEGPLIIESPVSTMSLQ